MRLTVVKVVVLVLAALNLAPSFAHLLETYPRLAIWPAELWRETTVFNAQFLMFAIVGAPIELLTILTAAALSFLLRDRTPNFALALAATAGFALSLAMWFAIVKPANNVLATWVPGPIPDNFAAIRLRWEMGHILIAAVKLVAFFLLALACVWPERDRVRAG